MFPANNTKENPNFPPFPCHQNPSSSTPEDDDPPFLYFPSPFLDDPPLSQIFANHHHNHHHQLLQPVNGEEPTNKKRSVGLKPRKRTGKKDRHSKIKTAQGVRDRRMRLSVQIARKFFDLQDMLGFDKASKTIEWLFSNSKSAIKELSTKHNANNGASSSSTEGVEGENSLTSLNGASAMEDRSKKEGENNLINLAGVSAMKDSSKKEEENNLTNLARASAMEDSSKKEETKEKTDFNLQAKESREKARARARERTKEKTMMTKEFHHESSNPMNNSVEMEELGFSSNPRPFLEEEPNSYITNNLDLIIPEKSSPHEASNSIASIFECYHNLYAGNTDYSPNSFMGNFLGNWDLDTDPRILISPFSGNPNSNI